jgi:membrane-associated protease RseP (regulator of RpoE activity)
LLPEDTPGPYIPAAADLPDREEYVVRAHVRSHRYWLHALLLLATLMTTTVVGARMQMDFDSNLPFMGAEGVIDAFMHAWLEPQAMVAGLGFSVTLLTILLAHELGHYIACVYYQLDASLPYFLPAPVLIGTFGAFIRIRSPIYSKRALFDVSAAGPLAGFVLAVPALAIGLWFSKVIPGIADQAGIRFGTPALVWLMETAIFPGTPHANIYMHPIARAASIGLLATAWNLLPIGQLDGGHLLYSIAGNRHKMLTRIFLICLLLMSPLWLGWALWAVLLFLFGRHHPPIFDSTPLGPTRTRLAWLLFVILLVSFTPIPFDEPPGT